MSQKQLDVLAVKEFEQNINGVPVKKTQWNRIGRAWITKSMEAVGFELFMFPGQRYLIQFSDKKQESKNEKPQEV